MKFQLSLLLLLLGSFLSGQKEYIHACATQKNNAFHRLADEAKSLTENQLYYDVTHYGLNLDFDTENDRIEGYVDISARVVDQSIAQVELDLSDAFVVSQVEMAGETLSFTQLSYLLVVDLPQTLNPGQSFVLRVSYAGTPHETDAFAFDSHAGKPMIWSLSEAYGAREWWPCKDYPADKADSVDMKFTVPSEMIVASNGTLFQTIEEGAKTTYWWKEKYPITTYLVSIAAYPFATFSHSFDYGGEDPMPVDYYVFPDNLAQLQQDYQFTVPMLTAFSQLFGPYPFINEKYGHAEYLGGGGMEHQTLTSLSGSSEGLIAHELAHQWWGDKVTNKSFHHIWLNEGFATYSEALWDEYAYGVDAYFSDMADNEYYGGGTIYVEDPETQNIFSGSLSYAKASWILHMLRHVVGDEVFFGILPQWAESVHAYGVATTEDFKNLCEQASGRQLDDFFDQWIYGEGYPIYELNWNTTTAGGEYLLDFTINQNQSGQLFNMPVDITVTTASGKQVFVVEDSLIAQNFQLILNEEPLGVVLDENNWILKKIGLNPSSVLADHDTGNCILTVSALGSIGYDEVGGNGQGFVYPSSELNTLYFGSFMVGNGNNYLVDSPGGSDQYDWLVSTNPSGNIRINDTHLSDYDVWAMFDDSGDETPKSLSVTQRSYSWTNEEDDDYVIIEYTLKNGGNQSLSNIYAGVYMDFDIEAYDANNVGSDEDLRMVYMYGAPYVGIELLGNSPVSNLTAINNPEYVYNGFTDSDKNNFLSGNIGFLQSDFSDDWSCLAASGPFEIAVGDSVVVAFAIVGGEDEGALLGNGAAAQQQYNFVTGFLDEPKMLDQSTLAIRPNPFHTSSLIEYELTEAGSVGIDILNAQGKMIVQLLNEEKAPGHYSTVWKAGDIPKGIYFCRLTLNGKQIFKKIVVN